VVWLLFIFDKASEGFYIIGNPVGIHSKLEGVFIKLSGFAKFEGVFMKLSLRVGLHINFDKI
jgi:hypothetical protein